MTKNQTVITGECFCAKIKYEIKGELENGTSCHCSRCRKAFNSQASAYSEIKTGELKWIQGENNLTNYVNKQGIGYQFCKTCGSTLCVIYNKKVVGVTLGCVN